LRLAEDGIRRILELLFEARPGGAFCYSRVPCSGGYVMRALHPCERRQLMHPPAALGQDLDDRDAAHSERVAHHRAVAAPRHRFGAHDRNALFTAQADECGKRVAEFRGLQVIGKAAEGFVSPAGVRGILAVQWMKSMRIPPRRVTLRRRKRDSNLYGAFPVKGVVLGCLEFFVRSGKAVLHPVACDQVRGARGRGQGTETLAKLGGCRLAALVFGSALTPEHAER